MLLEDERAADGIIAEPRSTPPEPIALADDTSVVLGTKVIVAGDDNDDGECEDDAEARAAAAVAIDFAKSALGAIEATFACITEGCDVPVPSLGARTAALGDMENDPN